jgi:hypothetical protein
MAKIGRNEKCPCGSGKKFKRCCGDPLKPPPDTIDDGAPEIGRLPTSAQDPDVQELLRIANLTETPEFLDYRDCGYAQNFCHVSAKHKAFESGGKRIHGWAIWQFNELAIAEFHSVWEDPDGNLVDVTPPTYGKGRILFVRDPNTRILMDGNDFILPTNITSLGDMPNFLHGQPTRLSNFPATIYLTEQSYETRYRTTGQR